MQPPHLSSQITQAYNVYVNPYGMRRLAPSFRPGSFDVLCARGKLAYDHEGNRRFRALVKQHQKQYSAATCKYEKSKIVSFIVSAVRNASPQGGFVKNIDGSWYEVGDRHAKEKVGQTFRDLLHTKYSSSTKAKARARMQRRIKDHDEDEEMEQSTEKPKKPEPVRSGNGSGSANANANGSSVSVVSNASMEDDSDAKTVAKSNLNTSKELPPLTSVVVKTEAPTTMFQHPGQHYLPHVSPTQAQRPESATLMETLRGNLHNYDGLQQQQSFAGFNLKLAPPPMPMAHATSDLEPLPLGQGPLNFKVDFNESSSSIQSEESFEDVMSEFCHNMSVPV